MNGGFHPVETVISNAAQWLRLMVEMVGALVVGIGVVVAIWTILHSLLAHQPFSFNQTRLSLARYLALALEFQPGRIFSPQPLLRPETRWANWARLPSSAPRLTSS